MSSNPPSANRVYTVAEEMNMAPAALLVRLLQGPLADPSSAGARHTLLAGCPNSEAVARPYRSDSVGPRPQRSLEKDTYRRDDLGYETTMAEVRRSITACVEAGYDLLRLDPTVDRRLPAVEPVLLATIVERTVALMRNAEDTRRAAWPTRWGRRR